MPAGNGTGPAGMGPMTGRGAGYCAGYGVPGYANPVAGQGLGRGFGRGFGMGFGRGRGGGGGGRWAGAYAAPAAYAAPGAYAAPAAYAAPVAYAAAPSPQQELDMLKGQAENLGQALGNIQTRIAELDSKTAE